MAKWAGKVGYGIEVRVKPGVTETKIIERNYTGDVERTSRRYQTDNNMNNDLDVSNEISLVADPFAYENFVNIKYVTWLGQRWRVSNINVQYPRLSLSIGGIYNGPTAEETSTSG